MIAISATFTAEAIQPMLAFWLRELDLQQELRFAPYNQVFQQLLDPASLMAVNRGGFNVVLLRLEDWSRGSSGDALEQKAGDFVAAVRSAAARFASPLIICVCPSSPGFKAGIGAEHLRSSLESLRLVHVISAEEIQGLYPVAGYHDPHADELGHVPYTDLFFAALATAIARKIHTLQAAPFKVIALDCDDTLWLGVCGEDGPQAVTLDPGRRALQEFLLEQRRAGMLLCLCSKNNEEDVLETFRAHPEMPLRPEHFVLNRINWEAKSANLISLAQELELGLDSFIFIDDNPEECAEVLADCPEVLTLPLPQDSSEIEPFLRHTWAFDRVRVTDEDRSRAERYVQKIERSRAEKQAASLEEFLASLELNVDIAPMGPEDLPRVAQLTHRTNQMNLTVIRRSESEIQNLIQSGEAQCFTVRVSDRFGHYGLTGVMITSMEPGALAVDTFLLSCRVLGRGVEHRMLAYLGELAAARGLPRVKVRFLRAQRNKPALLFLESIGQQFRNETEGGVMYEFPSEYARQIGYKPSGPHPEASTAPERGVEPKPRRIDYVRIARKLRTPQAILQHIRGKSQPVTAAEGVGHLESTLQRLWAELLGVPSVGIHENWFDLGGHSLLAVQLISRVRQMFDVNITLEVVYRGAFTIAELAKEIEIAQIEKSGAEQYESILRELEQLSDEQVRALLAQEDEH